MTLPAQPRDGNTPNTQPRQHFFARCDYDDFDFEPVDAAAAATVAPAPSFDAVLTYMEGMSGPK